jgi:hypothetical protein
MDMARYKQQVLDKLVGKMVSRKLLVWLVATAGVPLHFISGEDWVQISMVYIGSQAVMNFALEYARAKSGRSPVQNPEGL